MSETKPPRFAQLSPDQMSDAQKTAAEAILAGAKKADGPGGRYMAQSGQFPGPYNFLLRSPELAMRWRGLAEYIRFDTSVPLRLNELAILIQARWWTAQFEWWAHEPLAVRAGLAQSIADDIKVGKRPSAMQPDEEAVYDFCTEMMENRRVGDATFEKLKAQFTEQQIADLVAVTGFYATVSMILNTVEAGIPDGTEPPLKPLK
ncbi:4-carboxymuconolactone decarboxylase [Constrictibacter sp. MBR-5]|jgi:4-carboxymuconolactone decarboxylase|uniref:carboxymuconolactone decarboxylase family protein n=1 Tax=Constrictibacter sp. MBR-5 TaxID=3156467 RepID=UPI0033989D0C